MKQFKEWLEIVPLRESHSHLVVLQTGDIANALHEREARIQALIEQHPIANEIKELHREVLISLQA